MEMMVIFVVALLVLGPSKLPEAGRQVGKALAELRKWSSGVQAELRDAIDIDAASSTSPSAPHDPTPPTLTPVEPERPTPKPPSSFPDQQSFT
jgi:Tat protein translocase TatB subunit